MRIPGWLIFMVSIIFYISMTTLCSVASYATTRNIVIDARSQGLGVPNLTELFDYLINGVDELDANSDLFAPEVLINYATPLPTATAIPATATQPPPPGVTYTPEPTMEIVEVTEVAAVNPVDEIPRWEDPGRITLLLMGIDQRSALVENGAFHTDTMILVQIDPIRKTIGVLSIPRDLFVNIPGYEPDRINQANALGDSLALPGGGPGLAMETIRANLGVTVDRYVRINFDAFYGVVDTIAPDGVEICIEEEITDNKYPDIGNGFIYVHFDSGCQLLDATNLLYYARTRATDGGDFDRNRRQQQVLKALQAEVVSVGGITHFISQIPTLYNQLSGGYKTDLTLEEIIQLAQLVGEVPEENMTFQAINHLHVRNGITPEGDQILIPIHSQIRFVIQDAFDPQTNLTMAELRQRAENENSEIVIRNNTTIVGLASNTREWLTSQGVDIFEVGNVPIPANSPEIYILDYTGKPWTTRYLARLFELPDDAIRPGDDGESASDVMIVVGTDIQDFLREH
jgi:polyisoprenyl-teichoic acid--peptidoglycan teichoic acid transferase